MVRQYPALNRAESPEISLCIANYQGEALIRDCIDSLLAQECSVAVEIIVHDDASTDGSIALLRERYPQVEVLASDSNVGFCVANNRMAAAARGRFLLLLNNDAALLPGALQRLLDHAVRQPEPGILTLPQYDWQDARLVDRGCLLDPFHNPVPNLDPARTDVAMTIGACLFVPAGLWRELGGFPEWMQSIAEDLYLCGQARLRGYPVQALDGSGYRHRQGHSFGGNRVTGNRLHSTVRRRALSERNKTYALFVLTPGPAMWPLLAVHLAFLTMEGLTLALLRRSREPWTRIYWPAVSAPFRDLALLTAHRRKEQAARRIGLLRYLSVMRMVPRKLLLLWRHGVPRID